MGCGIFLTPVLIRARSDSSPANILYFSSASIWEIAIKSGKGLETFKAEPRLVQDGLLDSGYLELSVTGEHAVAVRGLPSIHKDPFDRILIAQARVEGLTLLTVDASIGSYPGSILRV